MGRPKGTLGLLRNYGITEEQYAQARASGLKWCSGECKKFLPVEQFHKGQGRCKSCSYKIGSVYMASLPKEKRLEYGRRSRTPEVLAAMRERASKRWKAFSAEQRQQIAFENRLWTRFRVRLAWFEAKLAEQGNCCATCDKPMGERRFAVDHDHTCCPGRKSCGKCVRGLVCDKCNLYLGMLEELMTKGDWILKGQAYLARYKET